MLPIDQELKDNITKWCIALWSGEYKQTSGELQNELGHCCLGVGCLIFIPVEEQKYDLLNIQHIGGVSPSDQPHSPNWLKEINNDFCIRTGKTLMELNDNDDMTFDEIADLLYAVYVLEIMNCWSWWWGRDQNDLNNIEGKKLFLDFNEMKTFSAEHSGMLKTAVGAGYWSNYEKIEYLTASEKNVDDYESI